MAADTTGGIDTSSTGKAGLDEATRQQSEEAKARLDAETRARMEASEHKETPDAPKKPDEPAKPSPPSSPSTLARTGDKGESSLTISRTDIDKPPEEPKPSLVVPGEKTEDKVPTGRVFGRQTIFHYNYDGSRDKDDPGSTGFFGANLDDKSLVGVAVPVDILEAQFGKFTRLLPNGGYAQLDTPEAQAIIARIKQAHVLVTAPDGRQVEMPIVDIQGSYKKWHRAIDLTLGAANALGIRDDTYLGYQVVDGNGTVLNADQNWSDSSPLAQLYEHHGGSSSPKDALAAAKAQIAPDMPDADYERAMRSPDGAEQIKKWRESSHNPGADLQHNEGGAYYGLSNGDVTKKVYQDLITQGKIDPSKPNAPTEKDIEEQLFPHPSITQSLTHLLEGDSDFWPAAARTASEVTHQASASLYAAAQIEQWDNALFGSIPGVKPLRDNVDKFIKEHMGGHNYFAELSAYVNGLMNSAQKQQEAAAKTDAERAAQVTKDVPGKVGAVTGGTVASLATQLPQLALGAPAKSAAAVAALINGAATFSKESQQHQSTAFIDALGSAGLAALWRYAVNSPAGWQATLGSTWLANTGEKTMSDFLAGKKIDPLEFGIGTSVDLLTGGLFHLTGGPEEPSLKKEMGTLETQRAETTRVAEERSALAKRILGPEVSEEMPWHAPGPIVSRQVEREAFSPRELSLAVGGMQTLESRLTGGVSTSELARQAGLLKPAPAAAREVHVADPEAGLKETRNKVIREEVRSMQEAKENGDTQKATKHADRAIAQLNGEEQKDIAKKTARYTEKFADNTATPGAAPKEGLTEFEKRMLRSHAGFGTVEVLEGRHVDDEAEVVDHLHMEALPKRRVAEAREQPDLGATPEAEFQAGFTFKPTVQAARSILSRVWESPAMVGGRERFAPGSFGEHGAQMEAIVRGRRSEAETTLGVLPADLARHSRIDAVLKGGEKVGVRQRFFSQFPKSIQKQMLIFYEQGKPVGNPIAQELFKFHESVYKAIERIEKAAGFRYGARDNYLFHAIKGGKGEQSRFAEWFKNTVSADPRWTHKRHYAQLEDLHKAGFELVTYNPEDLLQRRLFQHVIAVNKVGQMRDAERAGLAWNVGRKDITPVIKAFGGTTGELIVRAPNGERYYVRPDALPAIHNAWDMSSLYSGNFASAGWRALALAKSRTLQWRLFSLAHAKHMLSMNLGALTSTLTDAVVNGKFRGEVFGEELKRLGKMGYGSRSEVNVLQGKADWSSLSPEQRENVKHFEWSGSTVRVRADEEKAFATWAGQLKSNVLAKLGVPQGTRPTTHGAASLLQAGSDLVTRMHEWQFQTFIPQLKFDSVMRLRDSLMRDHPELFKPENEFKLKKALSDIGKDTENRFGQMFYDNLLWPKIWKQIGTTSLLSFGWNLGLFRMVGGAMHDTGALAAKILEDGKFTRDDITERMIFPVTYTASTMLMSAIANYIGVSIWNYQHPDKKQNPMPSGLDWFFPRTGIDAQGHSTRTAPVEYPREFIQWWQHTQTEGMIGGTLHMAGNKLNPILTTFLQEVQNRNFYGKEIADQNDPWLKQLQDRVKHVLQSTFEPMALSASPLGEQQRGRQWTWWDAAASFLGFPPASTSIDRSVTERKIIATYHRLQGSIDSELNKQTGQQYDALRQALKTKDVAAQKVAEKGLADLGVGKPQIKGFETHLRKHPDEDYITHVWTKIPPEEKIKLLAGMNFEERTKYMKAMSHEVRLHLFHKMRKTNPDLLKQFLSMPQYRSEAALTK